MAFALPFGRLAPSSITSVSDSVDESMADSELGGGLSDQVMAAVGGLLRTRTRRQPGTPVDESGLLNFNLLPSDEERLPGRVPEARLRLIEYWRRSRIETPEASSMPPTSAPASAAPPQTLESEAVVEGGLPLPPASSAVQGPADSPGLAMFLAGPSTLPSAVAEPQKESTDAAPIADMWIKPAERSGNLGDVAGTPKPADNPVSDRSILGLHAPVAAASSEQAPAASSIFAGFADSVDDAKGASQGHTVQEPVANVPANHATDASQGLDKLARAVESAPAAAADQTMTAPTAATPSPAQPSADAAGGDD